jgi:hypothetical protein
MYAGPLFNRIALDFGGLHTSVRKLLFLLNLYIPATTPEGASHDDG